MDSWKETGNRIAYVLEKWIINYGFWRYSERRQEEREEQIEASE